MRRWRWELPRPLRRVVLLATHGSGGRKLRECPARGRRHALDARRGAGSHGRRLLPRGKLLPRGRAPTAAEAPTAASSSPAEEAIDTLIGRAQRAMRDRHFIDPAEGSALALYRAALAIDPSSGEAHQGLQRLAEVLLARVQSALDERQFDAALQALENARSIDPSDKRLAGFDERIAKMRAELGPAEIMAAINAQNFDRAAQLIEQAARAKSMGESKLNQLREDLRRRRADTDDTRLVALIDARMQQDQLADPPNDSAVYYLGQARKAGATSAALQAQFRELSRRLTLPRAARSPSGSSMRRIASPLICAASACRSPRWRGCSAISAWRGRNVRRSPRRRRRALPISCARVSRKAA